MHSGDFFVCFCQSWSLKRHDCPEEGSHGAVAAAAWQPRQLRRRRAAEAEGAGAGVRGHRDRSHLAGLGWDGQAWDFTGYPA